MLGKLTRVAVVLAAVLLLLRAAPLLYWSLTEKDATGRGTAQFILMILSPIVSLFGWAVYRLIFSRSKTLLNQAAARKERVAMIAMLLISLFVIWMAWGSYNYERNTINDLRNSPNYHCVTEARSTSCTPINK